jgi:drug/metabolite transporter (DMT)-like permease
MNALSGKVLVAYLTVCIVWGSTYLAIRVGVRYLPPAVFGGTRFLVAGAVLLAVTLALGRSLPRRMRDWSTAAVVGVLLLTTANGLVIWAERYVESGTAAVFVVTVALWMAVFDAVIPGGERKPTWRQYAGLLAGFAGTLLLVGADLEELRRADWRGPLALIGASASWGLGSVYAKRNPVETGAYVTASLQMLIGGAVLLAIGLAAGEGASVRFALPGLLALGYLIIFGSIIGYTSYVYLLTHCSPTVAGTYAYVNPLVAVLLGWAILDEEVTLRTFLATAIVLGSVLWVRRESEAVRQQRPVWEVG